MVLDTCDKVKCCKMGDYCHHCSVASSVSRSESDKYPLSSSWQHSSTIFTSLLFLLLLKIIVHVFMK